ncbi:hypothetical protein [Ideonella livida]|uniref:Uncharacterized protein n=1 Tax=Ideonella livida TaxID=2707176 RepID=A0A7C9PF59_9BURK|nr:hypothetical protein [Ideonella livida]NDY90148.1 hypothetical protein [Ideonella livida]
MKTRNAGPSGAAARIPAPATAAPYVPRHYLRRLARSLVLRAALRGHVRWVAALPLLARLEGGE